MIIFTGVAGSGKSLQGKMLADELGLPWLSTGEFLRMLVSGEKREAMVAGKLLDDAEIIQLVRKIFALIDTNEEFVLDGFPRTIAQADWLLNQVKHKQFQITGVIHLTADQGTVLKRLAGRGRQDDTPEAIKERFKEYEETILPILEDFKAHNIPVYDISSEDSIESIFSNIRTELKV